MERLWTIKEKVGQEYYYQVKAEDRQEAIEKVKRGEAGTAKHTRGMPVEYSLKEV